jgi:DNA repair exonuclease SbcCD nuclease subunit
MESTQKNTHVRNWKNYLIAALSIALTVMWFARGCEKPEVIDLKEIAYQDTIRVLKLEKAQNRAQKDTVYLNITKRLTKDSVTRQQQNKRIAAANRRAAQAEAKISELTRQQHPEVVAALQANDTVKLEMQAKIDSLQASLYMAGKQLTELQRLDIDSERIGEQMMAACEERLADVLDDLGKANKQADKVPVLKRVVMWLGAIVIIETGVLILRD